MRAKASTCVVAFWLLVVTATTAGAEPLGSPRKAPEVSIRERLGHELDLELSFRDHRGRAVKLSQYFDGRTPVLLTLNYSRCRTVCDLQLQRLALRLRDVDPQSTPYRALSVSIDPRDGVEQARAKQARYAAASGRTGWSFLVGDARNVSALARELGVGVAYDPKSDQYAHPPALIVATPKARVARYLYGIDPRPRDVRFALIEASAGRSGSSFDRVLLTCFQYDRGTGRYGPYVLGLVRTGGIVTVIGLVAMVLLLRRGERRREHGA